jgi:hypothetical protein
MNGLKTIYKVCPTCGRKNKCYTEKQLVEKDTRFMKKGDFRIIVHCVYLDGVNRRVGKMFNSYLIKL